MIQHESDVLAFQCQVLITRETYASKLPAEKSSYQRVNHYDYSCMMIKATDNRYGKQNRYLFSPFLIMWQLYLIAPFWYASAGYQVSFLELQYPFSQDTGKLKYPWCDQMSLICSQTIPERYAKIFTVPKLGQNLVISYQ